MNKSCMYQVSVDINPKYKKIFMALDTMAFKMLAFSL